MRPRVPLPLALLVASGVAGCAGAPGQDEGRVLEGFEEGLGTWTLGSDVPIDPATGSDVAWTIEPSTTRVLAGSWGLRFHIDGRHDDGTVWIERAFTVPRGGAHTGQVVFYASFHEGDGGVSLGAEAVGYAGATPPLGEASFPARAGASSPGEGAWGGLREADRAEEWNEYSFAWSAADAPEGRVHVALGVTVAWEAQIEAFVDEAHIQIDRSPAA